MHIKWEGFKQGRVVGGLVHCTRLLVPSVHVSTQTDKRVAICYAQTCQIHIQPPPMLGIVLDNGFKKDAFVLGDVLFEKGVGVIGMLAQGVVARGNRQV